MDKRLRLRILTKLAQTTPNAPAPELGAPAAVPGELLTNLPRGYNGDTARAITILTNCLNAALHYASGGKGDFVRLKGGNLGLSGANPDAKHIGTMATFVYNTFLNKGNIVGKMQPKQIHGWADAILGGSDFSSLTQTEPGSKLSNYLQNQAGVGNLKDAINKEVTAIKNANPITA